MIPVVAAGDHWLNAQDFQDLMLAVPQTEPAVLDLRGEGPSLHALGVVGLCADICRKLGRDMTKVQVMNWSNAVETVPFYRRNKFVMSHFTWMSERYMPADLVTSEHGQPFGMFVGRPTVPRLLLIRHLWHRENAVLSLMDGAVWPRHDQGICAEIHQDWSTDVAELRDWYEQQHIGSLDGSCIRDQYTEGHNTNRSLLAHYDRFHIEVVAETYLLGDTFMPTEKTFRPMSAGKAMIVMGPKGFLGRLRDLGYRTWNEFWDETYDDLEGPSRLRRILEVIDDVAARADEIVPDLLTIARHNRNNLLRLIKQYRPGPF